MKVLYTTNSSVRVSRKYPRDRKSSQRDAGTKRYVTPRHQRLTAGDELLSACWGCCRCSILSMASSSRCLRTSNTTLSNLATRFCTLLAGAARRRGVILGLQLVSGPSSSSKSNSFGSEVLVWSSSTARRSAPSDSFEWTLGERRPVQRHSSSSVPFSANVVYKRTISAGLGSQPPRSSHRDRSSWRN